MKFSMNLDEVSKYVFVSLCKVLLQIALCCLCDSRVALMLGCVESVMLGLYEFQTRADVMYHEVCVNMLAARGTNNSCEMNFSSCLRAL